MKAAGWCDRAAEGQVATETQVEHVSDSERRERKRTLQMHEDSTSRGLMT